VQIVPDLCEEARSYGSKFMLHWPLWAPHVGLGEDFTRRGRQDRPRLTAFKSLLRREQIHTCIKIATVADVCSFKLDSSLLIHTSGETMGDVWLQRLQSTAQSPRSRRPHSRGLISPLYSGRTLEHAWIRRQSAPRVRQNEMLERKGGLCAFTTVLLQDLYHPTTTLLSSILAHTLPRFGGPLAPRPPGTPTP